MDSTIGGDVMCVWLGPSVASACPRAQPTCPIVDRSQARLALQEVGDERSELLAALDLSPMAASSEHVQSRVIDHIEQTKRGFQRDHLIVAPVNKQRGRRDLLT